MIGASNARRTTPQDFDYAYLPFLGDGEVARVLEKILSRPLWGTVFLHLGANSLFPSQHYWHNGILHTHRTARKPAEATATGYTHILETLADRAREVWVVPFYYRLHRKTCHCTEAASYTIRYQDLIRTGLEADLKALVSKLPPLPVNFLPFHSYVELLHGPQSRADVSVCLDADLVHLNHRAVGFVRSWAKHTARLGQN